jgi:protein O-GlcNAc transferase
LEQALILEPENTDLLGNLAAVRQDQGRLPDAVALYQRAVDANPTSNVAHSNLLMSLNYRSDSPSELLHAHQKWANGLPSDQSKFPRRQENVGAVQDNPRIKIGYVSGDFRSHSVAYFLEPILEHHDKKKFEIYCYASMDNPDSMTARMAALADHWRYIYAMTDAQLSSRIEEDSVDILVDLSGHTAHNRLSAFAQKMAPVQISWLGYPNTTGLKAIDFRFTDAVADPPGSEAHHSEKLLRLPCGFLCYRAPENAPPIAPSPYMKNRYITFGSFNNAAKITPKVIKAWSSVMHKTPNSRLYLKARPFADSDVCADFLDQFSQRGIDQSRLELTGRTDSLVDHLTRYREIDIALDTFPYNGTTTTCEAMWMGVPIVTLCGNRHAGRVGASLLSRVGLENCVARGRDEYIKMAVALAENHDYLSRLRNELRDVMKNSPLCDAHLVTSKIENAYRTILATGPTHAR